jgi:hypothetical protein
VWQAVGLSLALMAPSMAANINPQASAATAGYAVPLTFLIAAVGVLLVAYTFVRLCQYFHHSGSVYAFVGATLGPRAGVVAGWGLVGTYVFYAVTTAAAAGIFGTGLLQTLGIWPHPPSYAPWFLITFVLVLALVVAALPSRRGTNTLLIIECTTVTLIVLVAIVVFVRLIAGDAPGHETFTMKVFTIPHGVSQSALFLGVVFGFLSFAGFEASATLGEEAHHPRRDIPRAIMAVALFGGVYFVVVTAAEMMGFGTSNAGVAAFASSPSLLGSLGTTYIASWVGNLITLGTTVSAFGCCLASTVGAAGIRDVPRLLRATRTRQAIPVGHTRERDPVYHRDHGRDLRGVHGGRGHRDRRVRLVRVDRHADPAGGLPAGHHRHDAAGLRPAPHALGTGVAGDHPGGRRGVARLHPLSERLPVPILWAGALVSDRHRRVAGAGADRGIRAAGDRATARRRTRSRPFVCRQARDRPSVVKCWPVRIELTNSAFGW